MKTIFWMTQAALFYLLTLGGALVPATLAPRAGALAGLLMARLLPSRRAIAVENIRQALPSLIRHPLWAISDCSPEKLADETFENLGRSLMEVCRLYHGRGNGIINQIELRGREHYEAALAREKGIIFLTGHCGNWELLALAFSNLFSQSAGIIARRQDNPYLNGMVERMRGAYNSTVIYKQGALRGSLSALRKGKLIGILADQAVLPAEGVLIEVLGRTAWASKAPALIAMKSGAPLIPTFIHREGNRQVITFHPSHTFGNDLSEEGLRRETQALSRYVEDYVAAHPTQWYWVHRRWKRAGEHVDAA